MLALAPLVAYGIWWLLLGEQFHAVEKAFFSRGAFLVGRSIDAWKGAFASLSGDNSQTVVYYGIEFSATLLAAVTCLVTLRRYPGESLFGLLVILISFTSGVPQGMHRYVLAVPSIFMVLGRLGRNEVFDRAWTLASILLMGLLATLFAFDFWVG